MAVLAGIPQWMAARALTFSGGVGSTNEVMIYGLQGQGAPLNETGSSKTITAGPTTTGPVVVSENGVWVAMPFNVACSAPDWAFKCLSSDWTYA